jgi:hypothetical protein
VCKALDNYTCPPKVSGRCLVVDLTSNRIKQPYLPLREARDDLEVLTTELLPVQDSHENKQVDNYQLLQGGEDRGVRRATTSNRMLLMWKHRQKNEVRAATTKSPVPSNQKRGRVAEKNYSDNNNNHNNNQTAEDTFSSSSPGHKKKGNRKSGKNKLNSTEQLQLQVESNNVENDSNQKLSPIYSKTM